MDTEGRDLLSEIAVIDSAGNFTYEAFAEECADDIISAASVKPLKVILKEFSEIAQNKLIICHCAKHDIKVLKDSFRKVELQWPDLKFNCSYELAKSYFKDLPAYSLKDLSNFLNLKVDGRYFNQKFAHSAKYDAEFTCQLYKKIQEQKLKADKKINPFTISRVDSPFQNHVDVSSIYENEFKKLTSAIDEIKVDFNNQSRGFVVLGEPGTGKTHLMMRLVKEKLKSNRLFCIRQPNNPNFILYHIYSRMLESFVENVPGTKYSQLEYLLAKSFANIVIEVLNEQPKLTKKGQEFKKSLSENHLNLYQHLGGEGTKTKRNNWDFIGQKLIEWWDKAGHSKDIIEGLIKYCRYSDHKRKELVRKWLYASELDEDNLNKVGLKNWGEDLSKEDFSLEAIETFGKLSLVDEPLIIIFDQLEGMKHDKEILKGFEAAVKNMLTHVPNSLIILNLFPNRWEYFKSFFNGSFTGRFKDLIMLDTPDRESLKKVLAFKAKEQGINIDNLFNQNELDIILNQKSIRDVLNCASEYYQHKILGIPLPKKIISFEQEIREKLMIMHNDIISLKNSIQPPKDGENKVIEKEESPVSQPDKTIAINLKQYINEQKKLLNQKYSNNEIITSSDDFGKLKKIVTTYKTISKLKIEYLRLGQKTLPEHILIKTKANSFAAGFLHEGGGAFTSRIKNFNELVINYKDVKFMLFRDKREEPITAKVGANEIKKLRHASNGNFIDMDKNRRIIFELFYQIIVDIENKDFKADYKDVLDAFHSQFSSDWLINILKEL
ncbi:3'-5' exonuclease [Candidatus Magnetomoraceae bacterium gMMP-15]